MAPYFSETRGLRDRADLTTLRTQTRDLYLDLRERDRLTEWMGYDCVDKGHIPGTALNASRDIVLEVGRADIWPPDPVENEWSEDAIFDFLQFIGEKVSSPVFNSGEYHHYNDCGWHDQDFTSEPGPWRIRAAGE